MAISKTPFGQILPAYRPIAYELYADADTNTYRIEYATVSVYKGLDLIVENIPFVPVRNEGLEAVFTISTQPNTTGTVMPPSFSPMSFIGQPYTQGSPSSSNTIDFPPPGTNVPNSQILDIIKDALELNPYLNATFDFVISNDGGSPPVYTLTATAKVSETIPNFTIDLGTINDPTVRLPITLDNYATNTRYYFEIDLQGICQDTLSPFKGLPNAFTPVGGAYIDNTETYSSYRMEVNYYWLDFTANIIEASTIPQDNTSSVFVFACTRQHEDSMFLNEYFGTIGDQNNKFLTQFKSPLSICSTQYRYLSYIQPVVDEESQRYNYMEVKVYDSGGVLLSEGITVTTGGGNAKQYAINVGMQALSSLFYINTTPNLNDPSAAYYTVSIGRNTNAPDPPLSYFRESEIFRYNIQSTCADCAPVLHWLNELGGVDTFVFASIDSSQINTESQLLQSPLAWDIGSSDPHSIQDTGAFKSDIEASTSVLISSGAVSSETATLLSAIVRSPKVYLQRSSKLVPVVITSSDVQLNQKGAFNIQLTYQLANNFITLKV